MVILTVPSCIDFIDHNKIMFFYVSNYYSLFCMVAQFGFSAQMGKQTTVNIVMDRGRLDGHCACSTGFLLSTNVLFIIKDIFFFLPIS